MYWPILYFIYYAALAALYPYLPVYYRQLGVGGEQIGVLTAAVPLINLVSGPLWGWLADSRQRHKQVLVLSLVSVAVFGMLLALPRSFTGLLVVLIPLALFLSPIVPILDSSVLQSLGNQRERYGRIRLWGAIGWGVCAPLAGRLAERVGLQGLFIVFGALMGLSALLVARQPVHSTLIRPLEARAFSLFWADPRWRAFLFTAFSGGVLISVISNFLFLFLQDLGASQSLLGLSLTVATLSEVSILYVSSGLLKRWPPQWLMTVGLILFAVRALLYSFITQPWMAMLIQLMHGLTYALMWVAGVSYAGMMAPPGLNATAQGLFSSAIMGVGMVVGSLLGGFLLAHVGAIWMFRITSGVGLVGALILWSARNEHTQSV
ncbi:major facilitator superfamily domain-containing protein 6 [uncultured Thermanaerothrix sp.]|uniref:MFS transporter n=1 Tax=uncultured Thermanaerothrix sp. TaxID=1195149 RepID=UPI002612FE80|nr:major facilitator superfamily domain-containing protein 6 [uncultured Thermanaerothrix sp.]